MNVNRNAFQVDWYTSALFYTDKVQQATVKHLRSNLIE